MIALSFITIGDFDGVHLGHTKILYETVANANKFGQKAICLTFSNNTKKFFGKTTDLITDFDYKKSLILQCGISQVEAIDFDYTISSLSGEAFFDYIIRKYSVKGFVCGENFKCGIKASCDTKKINQIFLSKNIPFICIPVNGFSSTAVRKLISNGEINKANMILGRDFSYNAPIVSGNHIGTKIGYPTLNQNHLSDYLIPQVGVYASYIISNHTVIPSVTNIGSRPTVTDSHETVIETHLINHNDFEIESNSQMRVFFKTKIRDEIKFDNLCNLKKQIEQDIKTAEELFK